MCAQVVVNKLVAENSCTKFFQECNQKQVVRNLTIQALPKLDEVTTCEWPHVRLTRTFDYELCHRYFTEYLVQATQWCLSHSKGRKCQKEEGQSSCQEIVFFFLCDCYSCTRLLYYVPCFNSQRSLLIGANRLLYNVRSFEPFLLYHSCQCGSRMY